jgi:hypothetical protein
MLESSNRLARLLAAFATSVPEPLGVDDANGWAWKLLAPHSPLAPRNCLTLALAGLCDAAILDRWGLDNRRENVLLALGPGERTNTRVARKTVCIANFRMSLAPFFRRSSCGNPPPSEGTQGGKMATLTVCTRLSEAFFFEMSCKRK